MSKLKFRVIYFSSEDDEYPASELNAHSPQTRGWQSFRYCEYPQELGFEIEGGVSKLSQVQLLSHQSKISTKIEVFIGNGPDYHSAKFKRLGYLSLDSNERSNYQARELKTVYVDADGRFVRFIVHQCFINKYNHFNQVGIIAVNFLGVENPDAGKFRAPGKGNTIASGAHNGESHSDALTDLSVDLNLDAQTANKLRQLAEAKAKAVASEDYSTAKQIKLVEKDIRALGVELAQLDIAKQQAVKAEDYDRAILLKNETDELRAEIEDKVRNIRIPGVTGVPTRNAPSVPKRAPVVDRAPSDHVDIDSIPVGRGASAGAASYGTGFEEDEPENPYYEEKSSAPQVSKSTGKKKVLRTEALQVEDNDVAANPRGIASIPDEILPNGDRPIRPKGQPTYTDTDPEMPSEYPSGAGGAAAETRFPPGQHPLEEVPNMAELPAPEALLGKYKESSDSSGLTALVGDYVVRCLYSKTWALRDAAVTKIKMLLVSQFTRDPGTAAVLSAIATVLKSGLDDKIAQVFFQLCISSRRNAQCY